MTDNLEPLSVEKLNLAVSKAVNAAFLPQCVKPKYANVLPGEPFMIVDTSHLSHPVCFVPLHPFHPYILVFSALTPLTLTPHTLHPCVLCLNTLVPSHPLHPCALTPLLPSYPLHSYSHHTFVPLHLLLPCALGCLCPHALVPLCPLTPCVLTPLHSCTPWTHTPLVPHTPQIPCILTPFETLLHRCCLWRPNHKGWLFRTDYYTILGYNGCEDSLN